MYNFKRNKGINRKKRPGSKLKNSRNYAYSTCCDYCTKLLLRRNGTNVEERVNIENNLNLVYNIDYVI